VATPQIHVRNRNPFSVCFASSGHLTGSRSSLLPITYRSSPGQHSTTDKTTDDGDVGDDDDDDGPGVGMEPDASESDTRCRQQGVAADLTPILQYSRVPTCQGPSYFRGPSVACLPITKGGNTKTEIKPKLLAVCLDLLYFVATPTIAHSITYFFVR
jgi:hypothetical protein